MESLIQRVIERNVDIIRSHPVNPETLIVLLQEFLAESRTAVAVEDGAVVFDFSNARYSVSGEHGKCVLHLWSGERNAVRRVLDAESIKGTLRLRVQRFGKTKPGVLEICVSASGGPLPPRRQRG